MNQGEVDKTEIKVWETKWQDSLLKLLKYIRCVSLHSELAFTRVKPEKYSIKVMVKPDHQWLRPLPSCSSDHRVRLPIVRQRNPTRDFPGSVAGMPEILAGAALKKRMWSRWKKNWKSWNIHSRKLTWIPKMMVWKRYLPSKMAILGIYVRFLGCMWIRNVIWCDV